MDTSEDNQSKISQFNAYFSAYWMQRVTLQRFSVFSYTRGTNNDSESHNSRLKATIRQHKPNIYCFLVNLNNLIMDTNIDMERIDNGLQVTRKIKDKFRRNMARREEAKAKLSNGTYSVQQYLSIIYHTFDTSVAEFRIPDDDDKTDDPAGQQEQDPTKEGNPCGICVRELQRRVAILPCGHSHYCETCITVLHAQATEAEPAKYPSCSAHDVPFPFISNFS